MIREPVTDFAIGRIRRGDMRDWEEVAKRIQSKLTPRHRGILKCRGTARRKIVSNDGQTISVRRGRKTKATCLIDYCMIKYAFDRLRSGCIFDSPYFRQSYERKYLNSPCLYSMIGGILKELGLANRYPKGGKSCYYTPGKGLGY